MRSARSALLGVALAAAWPGWAQSTARPTTLGGSYAFGGAQIDPTLELQLGVGQTIPVAWIPSAVDVEGGLAIPLFVAGVLGNWRLFASGRAVVAASGRYAIVAQAALRVDRLENAAFDAVAFTAEAKLLPTYFWRTAFLSAEVGYRADLASVVQFSSLTLAQYQGDIVSAPRSGLYGFGGGFLVVGGVGGVRISPTTEITVRGGLKWTQRGMNPWADTGLQAVELGVGFDYRFGR